VVGAPAATVKLAQSDQINDGVTASS